MNDSTSLKSHRNYRRRRYSWCCSFSTPPLSPENPTESRSLSSRKTELPSNSPPQKLPLARRILSPGRVSPIPDDPSIFHGTPKETTPQKPPTPAQDERSDLGTFDVSLSLEGRNGDSLILELDSEILATNSSIFADLIAEYRKKLHGGLCRIEVPDVENLNVFRETIELMLELDIQKKLLKIGVLRAIDILEVSAGIKFSRCVSSCLKYLEAVPWTEEEEEEKLRDVLNRHNLDDVATAEVLDRLFSHVPVDSQQTLTKQLILSITTCTNANARNELKALVKALLSKSSVYEKDSLELNKQDILAICESCVVSLVSLLEEASQNDPDQKPVKINKDKPLVERISKQVDNINWLLDILLDHLMAEEFVDLWASQRELRKMHEKASPMVRYELSRVSSTLFIAMGNRKLHCRSETRLALIQVWFKPMLSDFGWLQRCRKGLDMKALEEAMGQALLTLPLKEQNVFFMEWFSCFSKCGVECPNLSKAFQIWWRRSSRGSETLALSLGESLC